jgi:hypothetical protein
VNHPLGGRELVAAHLARALRNRGILVPTGKRDERMHIGDWPDVREKLTDALVALSEADGGGFWIGCFRHVYRSFLFLTVCHIGM